MIMKREFISIACIAGSLLLFLVIWKFPKWQVRHLRKSDTAHEVFLAENEARRTVIQVLSGFFLLFGLTFTYLQWLNAQRSLEATQDWQVTERFSKATEQLGSDKLEIRLGAIYSLERIAWDSRRDHWPTMEVLTTFVRQRSPWSEEKETLWNARGENPWANEESSPKVAADIQSVLTVIGRRKYSYEMGEDQLINLSGTDLRRAVLEKANLEKAVIANAHMEWARMSEAKLNGANLVITHLERAYLDKAQLRKAALVLAFLIGANLEEADLREATLGKAVMIGAKLKGAMLQGADLREARLEGAILRGADVQGANLSKAVFLDGADLEEVKNLTNEQVKSAITDETTKLPKYLKKGLG